MIDYKRITNLRYSPWSIWIIIQFKFYFSDSTSSIFWCTITPTVKSSPPSVAYMRISIDSANSLSPIRRQAIILTSAVLLSIGSLGKNVNEIVNKIQNFSFTKVHLKISAAKGWPFCPGGDESILRILNHEDRTKNKTWEQKSPSWFW